MVAHDQEKKNEAGAETRKAMKKGINLVLEDADLIELMRILMDEDAEAALVFLKQHLKGKLRETLEGG
jgi:hypothetical protein